LATIEINKFEQEDLRNWGLIAVASVTLMVMISSASAILPSKFINTLRETRENGGTINQLQAELTAIKLEFSTMKRESSITGTRITLSEETGTKFSRRVRALESSIPMLLEALPADADIDRSLITASINAANGEEIIVNDGELKVSRSDLFDINAASNQMPVDVFQQELPEMVDGGINLATVPDEITLEGPMVEVSSTEFGLIIGPNIKSLDGNLAWEQYKAKIGTLLLGLEPRLLPVPNDSSRMRLMAGPLTDMAEALTLCLQISRAGLDCEASGFGGTELTR